MNTTGNALPGTSAMGRLCATVARADSLLGRFPMSVTQLALRFAVALPFWRSAQTKWTGWFELSDSQVFLFQEEFRLHLFGAQYAFPFPETTAYVTAIAETVLPVLLVLGLATRFAALGILLMTAMIQLTVPDGWATYHLPWAAMALAVMTFGPGRLALDHLLARTFAAHGR